MTEPTTTHAGRAGRWRAVLAVALLALGLLGGLSPAEAATEDTGDVGLRARVFLCTFPGLGAGCTVADSQPGRDDYFSNRDCGWSLPIHTDDQGRQTHLWVFCDTPLFRHEGEGYRPLGAHFTTNSASLARFDPNDQVDDEAEKTEMAFSVRTTPTPELDHARTFWSEFVPRSDKPEDVQICKEKGGYLAAWPGSAVALEGKENAYLDDDSTKPADAVVLIFFQDLCVYDKGHQVVRLGSGVAEWTWSADPALDPHQQLEPTGSSAMGLRAKVLRRDLFASDPQNASFHYGATVEDLEAGRFLRLLRCHKRLADPQQQPKTGCEVAQVPITRDGDWKRDREVVADIEKWRYWRYYDWAPFAASEEEGAPPTDGYDMLRVPDVVEQGGYDPLAPDAHTSIVRHGDRWLMIAMQTGFTDDIVVRTARRYTGPWSRGRVLQLPADHCDDRCYAPVFQPQLDPDDDTVAISYVDADAVSVCTVATGACTEPVLDPLKQQMRTATIPLTDFPAPSA